MRGAQPTEVILARLRPHGRALFWPCLLLVAIAFASGYFYGRFPESWQNTAVAAAGVVLAIFCWLLPTLRWLSRNYTITSRRVIVRRGILVRIRQEVPHSRGYSVTLRRSGLQGLFGSGDVAVSGSEDGVVVLADVPRAGLVQAALHDLIEAAAPQPPDDWDDDWDEDSGDEQDGDGAW